LDYRKFEAFSHLVFSKPLVNTAGLGLDDLALALRYLWLWPWLGGLGLGTAGLNILDCDYGS